MTPAPELTAEQRATLARIEAAPPAVESFRHRPTCPWPDGECPCPPAVVRVLPA